MDTMICYDVRSKETTIVLTQFIDTSTSFDNTQWNYGSVPGFTNLSLEPPSNPAPHAGFTDIRPAHDFFPVTNYPARTAVKLFRFKGDSLKQICSGTLVAKDLVLTSSHCLYNYFDTSYTPRFADSILAIPAYDNAEEQPEFGASISKAYFIPKKNLISYLYDDIALVQLREPIGLYTGWTGIAFAAGNAYFKNMVFHKFSYPGVVDPYDSSRVFNGDTMYYNYGTLDLIEDFYLGYNISGIPGQSGSSLLYTDNIQYWAAGTLTYAGQSEHPRLTRGLFYAFKTIIERIPDRVPRGPIRPLGFVLMDPYPNPFNPTTTVSFVIPKRATVLLRLYDILGRQVLLLHNGTMDAGSYTMRLNGSSLTSGIYFLRMESTNFVETKKLVLLK